MSEIIDLGAERNARSRPDSDHIRRDDFGREMFEYILGYDMDGSSWGGVTIWAYSTEDAESRVHAMRESLRLDGQIFAIILA
jgi:hypothetical protein